MSQCADNFRFDITAWTGHYRPQRDIMAECLALAFANHSSAEYWTQHVKDKKPRLIFLWSSEEHAQAASHKLLAPMGPAALSPMVHEWLKAQDYGREPDHDGDNSKGWRIYNEGWGHIEPYRYSICAIEPAWLMHGK